MTTFSCVIEDYLSRSGGLPIGGDVVRTATEQLVSQHETRASYGMRTALPLTDCALTNRKADGLEQGPSRYRDLFAIEAGPGSDGGPEVHRQELS